VWFLVVVMAGVLSLGPGESPRCWYLTRGSLAAGREAQGQMPVARGSLVVAGAEHVPGSAGCRHC